MNKTDNSTQTDISRIFNGPPGFNARKKIKIPFTPAFDDINSDAIYLNGIVQHDKINLIIVTNVRYGLLSQQERYAHCARIYMIILKMLQRNSEIIVSLSYEVDIGKRVNVYTRDLFTLTNDRQNFIAIEKMEIKICCHYIAIQSIFTKHVISEFMKIVSDDMNDTL